MGKNRVRKGSSINLLSQNVIKANKKATHQSSEDKFQIGDREKKLLKDLFDWSEKSDKTHWVLGRPLGAQE